MRVGAVTGRRVLCATQLSTRWNSSLFKVKKGSKSTDMRQISKAVARGAQRGSARPPTLLAHLDQRRARAARLWAHMQSVMIRCAARSRRGCGAVRREDMGSRNCRVVSSLVHLSRKMVCDFWDLHRPSSRAVLARTHTRSAGLTGPCTRSVRDAPASPLHLRTVIRPSRSRPAVARPPSGLLGPIGGPPPRTSVTSLFLQKHRSALAPKRETSH